MGKSTIVDNAFEVRSDRNFEALDWWEINRSS